MNVIILLVMILAMMVALFGAYSYRVNRDNDVTAIAVASLKYSVNMKTTGAGRARVVYKGWPVSVSFVPASWYGPGEEAEHNLAVKRAWEYPLAGVLKPGSDGEPVLYVRDGVTGGLVEYDSGE